MALVRGEVVMRQRCERCGKERNRLGEARLLLVPTLRFSAALEVLSPQDVGVFSSYSEPATPFLKYPG